MSKYLSQYPDLDSDSFDKDFMNMDRQARRQRKKSPNHKPKKEEHNIIAEIADADGLEPGFESTYKPGLFEEGWLLQSLRSFYDQAIITDVLGRVKGGKEASVYRCAAHESVGEALIAAKVYRPRMFRSLRNDKAYQEGRNILNPDGRAVKKTDHRMMRAIGKKSAFGQAVSHTSWLMYEYTTLQKLHRAGASVPRPIAASENAIMMSYLGDEHASAPTLNGVWLDPVPARRAFDAIIHNVEIMLGFGFVHGDLSAYNILYWDEDITLIDFPQVTDIQANSQAYPILLRDLTRICEYFAGQGLDKDPQVLMRHFWDRFGPPEMLPME